MLKLSFEVLKSFTKFLVKDFTPLYIDMTSLDAKIIFRGSKTFWKTKSSLKIVMVEHQCLGIIEIISYDPCVEFESKRLYLRTSDLVAELPTNHLVTKLKQASSFDKTSRLRVQEEIQQAKVMYLFNHMFIAEYLPESNIFPEEREEGYVGDEIVLECRRPTQLIPYATSFEHEG